MDPKIQFATYLNLVMSAMIFLIGCGGIVLYYWSHEKPRAIKESPFLTWPLWYSMGWWFCFTVTWILICFEKPDKVPDTWQLMFADAGSICSIGFSISFMMGKNVQRKQVLSILILLLLVFVLIEFGTGLYLRNQPMASISLDMQNWVVTPSQILAIVGEGFLALAFVSRYGGSAIPIVLACVFYAALQHFAYVSVFIEPEGSVRLLLAAGKVFLGGTFYATFFQPTASYEPIRFRVPGPVPIAPLLLRAGCYMFVMLLCCLVVGYFAPPSWNSGIKSASLWLGGLIASAVIGSFMKDLLAKGWQQLKETPPSPTSEQPPDARPAGAGKKSASPGKKSAGAGKKSAGAGKK